MAIVTEVTWRYGESQFPGFEADARAASKMHTHVERAKGDRSLGFEALEPRFSCAREHFATKPAPGAEKAAGCFLENYDLIRGASRQVAAELPRGLADRLPRLVTEGAESGAVRVHVLARTFVLAAHVEVDADPLQRFVQAYQEAAPLTMGELWALPTMLRYSVLRALAGFLHRAGALGLGGDEPPAAMVSLASAGGVERSVRALRRLAGIDWRSFFEKTSLVESILRTDPAGLYAQLDFGARHACRGAVEDLAWNTQSTEMDIAARTIVLAQSGTGVEHYLAGTGRAVLEKQIGYRPRGTERLRRAWAQWRWSR